jgi:hypothetical protein
VIVGAIGHHSGRAFAQTPGGPKDPGRYEEILAQKLGITVEQLRAAQLAARDELLAEAVANGRLTQEQADKIKNARDAGQGLFKGNLPLLKGPRIAALRNVFGAAAEAIGITEQQLFEGLRAGKSIAEIAEENDVDRDDLEEDILDSLTEAIDQAQTDGKITAEQATRLKNGLAEHIDQVLDRKPNLERKRDIQRMAPLPPMR